MQRVPTKILWCRIFQTVFRVVPPTSPASDPRRSSKICDTVQTLTISKSWICACGFTSNRLLSTYHFDSKHHRCHIVTAATIDIGRVFNESLGQFVFSTGDCQHQGGDFRRGISTSILVVHLVRLWTEQRDIDSWVVAQRLHVRPFLSQFFVDLPTKKGGFYLVFTFTASMTFAGYDKHNCFIDLCLLPWVNYRNSFYSPNSSTYAAFNWWSLFI